MTPSSFKLIVQSLNQLNIPYTLANESLIGFSEGDIHKYSPNIHFFIFHHQWLKFFYFSINCLFKGIMVKPKKIDGVLRYKIRKKNSIYTKEGAYAWLHIMNKTTNGWKFSIGKRTIEYSDQELSPKNQDMVIVNNAMVYIPKNWRKFVLYARKKLLAEFYPIHSVELQSDNEQEAINLLIKTTQTLDKLNIDYWLEGGTLLGAVRDQKLIPWDHDLDIGIKFTNDEEIKRLIKLLKKQLYVRPLKFPSDPKLWNLGKYRVIKVYTKKSAFKRTNLCLDIFLYYKGEVDGKGEMYRYVVWGNNACHPPKFFDNLDEITFYDSTFKIPSNPKEFLCNKYGKDWKVPNKNWNVAIDDGSIIR